MNNAKFLVYLICMAGITYLIRMIPFVLFKKEIKNKYVLSFLHYIPYAVLSVMTIPAIFNSTENIWSAIVGTVTAVILAFMEKSLLTVAAASCVAVFVTEYIMKLM
ncbi:MAG: AzlD domain-containing protein [Ruminococcaceae bacterium]|nr:AzlD domain-containing protein [Oscillospiraceae bacterium]